MFGFFGVLFVVLVLRFLLGFFPLKFLHFPPPAMIFDSCWSKNSERKVKFLYVPKNWQFGNRERPQLLSPQETGKQHSTITLHILGSIHQHSYILLPSEPARKQLCAGELTLFSRTGCCNKDPWRWEHRQNKKSR